MELNAPVCGTCGENAVMIEGWWRCPCGELKRRVYAPEDEKCYVALA